MSVTPATKYVCDRCGIVEHADEGAPAPQGWREWTHRHINGDLVRVYILCSPCDDAVTLLASSTAWSAVDRQGERVGATP